MKCAFLFFTFFSLSLHAQQKIEYKGYPSLVWPKLYNITYETKKDAHGEYQKPIFSKEVRQLEGSTIVLPGYLVPFDNGRKTKRFMLSSTPLNACFFCGIGGPETAIEVVCTSEVTYTDKLVEISGVLKLNENDPGGLIYILEKATFLGEIEF